MRAPIAAVLVQIALVSPLLAAPRISFDRLLPPPHDLRGAEDVAVVMAIGDHANIESFVEHFLHHANRGGTLRVRDRRGAQRAGAEAQLAIKAFTCAFVEGTGEGSVYDVDGKRVKRKHVWIDARCVARLDLDVNGHRSSFYVKGEGTSPRVEEITDEERDIAAEQATRYAGIDAAERLKPRRVRESIPLDETAPAFEEGMELIALDRFADARAVWERALRQQPRSAPLHYNLAAVCEALGDPKAAEQHYRAARELAPGEKRYANELRLFARRTQKQ
jgi:tetratricopeptide (TPR) repeat protein